jgi:hypothetical protein
MKLSEKSKLAHNVFVNNFYRTIDMPYQKIKCRYLVRVVNYRGVWDQIIYDPINFRGRGGS